jgi:hypothetical protein
MTEIEKLGEFIFLPLGHSSNMLGTLTVVATGDAGSSTREGRGRCPWMFRRSHCSRGRVRRRRSDHLFLHAGSSHGVRIPRRPLPSGSNSWLWGGLAAMRWTGISLLTRGKARGATNPWWRTTVRFGLVAAATGTVRGQPRARRECYS